MLAGVRECLDDEVALKVRIQPLLPPGTHHHAQLLTPLFEIAAGRQDVHPSELGQFCHLITHNAHVQQPRERDH